MRLITPKGGNLESTHRFRSKEMLIKHLEKKLDDAEYIVVIRR